MSVSIKKIVSDLSWKNTLNHRVGEVYCLMEMDIFYDFNWYELFGHDHDKFPGGRKLAKLVKNQCPTDKIPAILLTIDSNANEESKITDTHFFVIVKIKNYLLKFQEDTAATYFALKQLGNHVIPTSDTNLLKVSKDIESNIKKIVELLTQIDASDLQISNDVLIPLIDFIKENYSALLDPNKTFLSLDKPFCKENAKEIKKLFSLEDRGEILSFIVNNKIIARDIELGLVQSTKEKAILEFENFLLIDEVEETWQKWFEKNTWVLGTEFVRVLDERHIDTKNISDFLVEAYDGFLDIVEIKRPGGSLDFWANSLDHGNYIPHINLIKAITQASIYIHEIEQEADSNKFLKRVDNIKVIKPRCILIYGRSNKWNPEQFEAYRILNSSYHNLTILTYDHVLQRARRSLGLTRPKRL